MFHCDHRAAAAESDADGYFEGDFLIGRPLGTPSEGCKLLQYFCGRGSGISCTEVNGGIARGQRDGLISAQKRPMIG